MQELPVNAVSPDQTAQEKEEAEENVKAPSLRKRLPLFLGIFVLQAVLAYFVVTKVVAPRTQAESEPPVTDQTSELPDIGAIYVIKDIITNPAQTAGTRFVNTTIGLEVQKGETTKELEKRLPQIRDILLDIFSSKTVEQLGRVENRQALRSEILSRINSVLTTTKVVNVYFIDFVLQ